MTVDVDALPNYMAELMHTPPPPPRVIVSQKAHELLAALPAWVFDRNLPLVSLAAEQMEILYELWALGLAAPAPDDARFWHRKGTGK